MTNNEKTLTTKEPTAPAPIEPTLAGGVVNFVLRSLPLPLIHYLRDIGVINILNDVLAVLIGLGVVITRPKLAIAFILLTKRTRSIKYGNQHSQIIQIIDSNDSFNNRNNNNNNSSNNVLLYIHGGAWGSGKPWMYRLIADGTSQLLECSHVVVVGYPVYPYANIYEQSQSIYDAVNYIKENENKIFHKQENYNYILCGHSSGAHVSAMAILKSIQNSDNSKLVDYFIGLAGVYDICSHYNWEIGRGVEEISPMKPAAEGFSGFDKSSPTRLLQQNMMTIFNEIVDETSYEKYFPPTILLHGENDDVVPYTSTTEFANELVNKKINNEVIYFEGDHGQPILDMMKTEETTFKKSLRTAWRNKLKMRKQ